MTGSSDKFVGSQRSHLKVSALRPYYIILYSFTASLFIVNHMDDDDMMINEVLNALFIY